VHFRRGRMSAQLDTGSIQETLSALSKAVSNAISHSVRRRCLSRATALVC